MCSYECVCMCALLCLCVHVYMRVCMCIYARVWACDCVYVRDCVCHDDTKWCVTVETDGEFMWYYLTEIPCRWHSVRFC